jgi:hypothetical protein
MGTRGCSWPVQGATPTHLHLHLHCEQATIHPSSLPIITTAASNITMSTPNVAAAVRVQASNTPKPSKTLGFDVIAKHLTDH